MTRGTLARLAAKAAMTIAAAGATWGVILAPMGTPAPADAVTTASACVAYAGAQLDYDGERMMQEDEAPSAGLYGGRLVDYSSGSAWYSDGSMSDGTCWVTRESAPEAWSD